MTLTRFLPAALSVMLLGSLPAYVAAQSPRQTQVQFSVNAHVPGRTGETPPMLLDIIRQFQGDPHAVNVGVSVNGGPDWETTQRPTSVLQATFSFDDFAAFERWYAQPATRQALEAVFTRARQFNASLSVNRTDPSAPSTPVPIIRGN